MSSHDDTWYRLELLTEDADLTSTQLWQQGAAGVEVQDRDTYMEDGSIPPVPEGKARLIAFFSDPAAEEALTARFQDSGTVELLSFARFDDRSWETAWKKYFRPVLLSPRIIAGPPWEQFGAPPGGVRLVIEPGMAFGTGTHETTRLCAELLDEALIRRNDASVLDVGCGSAILTMAAKELGAQEVVGIDIDPTAIRVARENVTLNEVTGVDLSTTPLQEVAGRYDVVIANILGHILLDLRDALIDRLGRDGVLIMSGVTVEQAAEFIGDFSSPRLELEERRELGEWVAFRLRRSR